MNTAYVDWSLEIECPSCKQEFNLAYCDDDGVFASAIFNNNWDSLRGDEVQCIYCEHKFKIDSVEY